MVGLASRAVCEDETMTIRAKFRATATTLFAALLLFSDMTATVQRAAACPFCSAAMATLGQ
jgi:hypothetical protein